MYDACHLSYNETCFMIIEPKPMFWFTSSLTHQKSVG